MQTTSPSCCSQDRQIVRELARRIAEIAAMPIMAVRRDLWRRHNVLEQVRPVIYVDPQGAWCELIPENTLLCQEQKLREIEWELRRRIYIFEHFSSDNVIEKEWVVHKVIQNSGWGLTPRRRQSEDPRGASGFDPVLRTPDDLKKLKYPEISYDAAASQ
ncbi:MAG: hypothetical protein L6437_16450, partial [Kiritimatiellae bacterium]|nr:hypothetical protein [Kiritimatiellia bacterium]